MRIILVLTVLFLTFSANAKPHTPPDELNALLVERGLLGRIGEVSHKMEAKASELVVNAMAFLGVPYKRGGTDASSGFDCSGFVRAIFEQTAGLVLPRKAAEQAAASQKIDRADLQPGDLVFFNTMRRAFSHVGIYVGEGKFIHAPKPGAEVRVESLSVAYWARRFDGARRVSVDDSSKAASP
jgi:cell wall-associated NlpC family hydrolase